MGREQHIAEARKRLRKAFNLMKRRGLLARMNFSCCGGCASSELRSMLDSEEYADRFGAVFYHSQDAEDIKSRGYVYLGYGHRSDADEDTTRVGQMVVNALDTHDLTSEWNGDPTKRIKVLLVSQCS